MSARDLYSSGQLSEAIDAQNAAVRTKPSDIEERSFLCELLCLVGNLDRADAQCETISRMDPSSGPSLNLVRQLIRAEKTRQEIHREGRSPEFLGDPPEHLQLLLKAKTALREGDESEAARLAADAEEKRPVLGGRSIIADATTEFDDFRDLDDLSGGVVEVLTSTGRVMWIPLEQIDEVDFDAPERPLDLLWRAATMNVREGPEGKVYLPAVYTAPDELMDDAARLGKRTDWISAADGKLISGLGMRTYLVGEEPKTLLELERLEFNAASSGADS